MNYQSDFKDYLTKFGIGCGGEIIANGEIQRFKNTLTSGSKNKNKNAWYVMYQSGDFFAGVFGEWSLNIHGQKWNSNNFNDLSKKERTKIDNLMAEQIAQQQRELELSRETARKECKKIWDESTKATTNHPYLKNKGFDVMDLNIRVNKQNKLVIPLFDEEGTLHSLQTIQTDGFKQFYKDGATKGHYCVLGNQKESDIIFISEGYATALSIHLATDSKYCVVVAFNAYNLLPVAKTFNRLYADKSIVIAGDDDRFKESGNKGLTICKKIKNELGLSFVIPKFDDETKGTDFNDLHQQQGLAIVKNQVLIEQLLSPQDIGKRSVPAGFSLRDNGLFFFGADSDQPIEVCDPLYVTAISRDDGNEKQGRLLEWYDKDGQPHKWNMPMRLLAGDGLEVRANLMDSGLNINPTTNARKQLSIYLQKAEPQARVRTVLRTGWFNNCFVLPNKTIGEDKTQERVMLQSDESPNPFKSSGELKDWQANISSYCVGNSRLLLSVSLAFSSPLLGVLDTEQGGINLKGNSSTGKSTALKVACSVMSEPNKYRKQWKATVNGIEATASNHNHLMLALDEMGQMDAKQLGETAYMLSNGQGKQRANKSGGTSILREWKLMILSTGELSIKEAIESIGGKAKAGQEVRMIDINADVQHGIYEELHEFNDGAELSEHLNTQSLLYHGTAFEVFLNKLILNKDKVKPVFDSIKGKFIEVLPKDIEVDGQVKRIANRFALIATAGELATKWGVTGWQENNALEACITCFKDCIDDRGGYGSQEEREMLEQVRDEISKNRKNNFLDWEKAKKDSAMINEFWGYFVNPTENSNGQELSGFEFRLTNTGLKSICKGFNVQKVVGVLRKNGFIILTKDGKSTYPKKDPITKNQMRFYRIKSEILNLNNQSKNERETSKLEVVV